MHERSSTMNHRLIKAFVSNLFIIDKYVVKDILLEKQRFHTTLHQFNFSPLFLVASQVDLRENFPFLSYHSTNLLLFPDRISICCIILQMFLGSSMKMKSYSFLLIMLPTVWLCNLNRALKNYPSKFAKEVSLILRSNHKQFVHELTIFFYPYLSTVSMWKTHYY